MRIAQLIVFGVGGVVILVVAVLMFRSDDPPAARAEPDQTAPVERPIEIEPEIEPIEPADVGEVEYPVPTPAAIEEPRAAPMHVAATGENVEGLGWSVARFIEKWGPDQGWVEVSRTDVPSGGIQITATNRKVAGFQYMLMGELDGVRSVTMFVTLDVDDSNEVMALKLAAASVVLAEVSNWTTDEISSWIGHTLGQNNWQEKSHAQQLRGQKLWLNNLPSSDGLMILIGVETEN